MDAQRWPRRHGMDAMVEPWHDEGGGGDEWGSFSLGLHYGNVLCFP